MRIPRVYYQGDLAPEQQIILPSQASHYLAKVLRLEANHPVIFFNGDGHNYHGYLLRVEKQVTVFITQMQPNLSESPLQIHLGQVISRGEKMDFTLQKAVELGVTSVTPLISARCNVKLTQERQDKKSAHWQGVIVSACEQSGRSVVPACHDVTYFRTFLENSSAELKVILDPKASISLKTYWGQPIHSVNILIGSEGGFTDEEIALAKQYAYTPITLGARILRTETAGLCVMSLMQALFGDLML
jgi:16S rRNA (uracil1498-N3)-methyltransferase